VGQDTRQIEGEIRAHRSELGRNLRELEGKARDLTDWRTHHRNHAGLFLSVAFGGGLLLGLLTTSGRRHGVAQGVEPPQIPVKGRVGLRVPQVVSHTSERAGRQIGQTWDRIVDALLGLLAAKAVEFVGERVPGFRDHDGGATSGPKHNRRWSDAAP
jgi:hypothetical protein